MSPEESVEERVGKVSSTLQRASNKQAMFFSSVVSIAWALVTRIQKHDLREVKNKTLQLSLSMGVVSLSLDSTNLKC